VRPGRVGERDDTGDDVEHAEEHVTDARPPALSGCEDSHSRVHESGDDGVDRDDRGHDHRGLSRPDENDDAEDDGQRTAQTESGPDAVGRRLLEGRFSSHGEALSENLL
jgi:hypothetical protein